MKLFIKTKQLIKDNWSDPVWSKVISAVILSTLTFIVGIIWFGFKSVIDSRSLLNGLDLFRSYLNTDINFSTKRYFFIVLLIAIIAILIPLLTNVKHKIIKLGRQPLENENSLIEEDEDEEVVKKEDLPIIYDRSTTFFDNRIADAFPGQRGLKWYKDPKVAVERLNILLKNPLFFSSTTNQQRDPIWWFRGGRNSSIKTSKVLAKNKILIGHHEFEIDEIAVNRDSNPEKNFIYIKTTGEYPVGVYDWSKEDYIRNIGIFGFHREEYALFNNKHPITREEYDDGSAIIDNKVIDSKSSKLRIRYLTPYNLIVAAKQSAINSNEFDSESAVFLDGILQGTHTFEQLFEFLQSLNNPVCL